MGFASTYIETRVLFPEFIDEAPYKNTGIIVIVPAYNEPDVTVLLDSLSKCSRPECEVEVIIVVNAPSDATEDSIRNNEITLKNIKSWKIQNNDCFFRLFSFKVSPVIGGWGVGLARKTGMDEAVRRFNYLNKPEGVILNVDADCRVQENYFKAVYSELLIRKERSACSIYFEHPVSGTEFPDNVFKSITLYELHLRYYLQALFFTGFPDVYHTVGSAIAVKALTYIKAGGMNRKQAGEDFYFIQKLVPAGGYFSLNSTTVYPSPRESFRVPFGTGAAMGKLALNEHPSLLTYNLNAFNELRIFFEMTESFFSCTIDELAELYTFLPEGMKSFINDNQWIERLTEIKENTSGYQSFRKRFFGWFNMFKVMKYLNFVHQELFEKQPVAEAASALLYRLGVVSDSEEPVDLLNQFRSMERT
jgi:glycosyltransferase involved in cell wall biosynthesis